MTPRKISPAASAIGYSDDLLREILIRLPVRDLIRLKSVSTQWKRIISDPLFAATHPQTTHLRPPAGVILYNRRRNIETVTVPIFGNPPTSVPSLSFMRKIIANIDYHFTHIQSCNGLLLCLFMQQYNPVLDLESHCFVCNPTTGDSKLLPLPPYLRANECLDGLTLAFSPLEPLRYNVLGIKKYKGKGFDREERAGELHIYSSETNCWKLGSSMEGLELNSRLSGVFLNGTVYWSGGHQMHYYNVYSEEIGSLRWPHKWWRDSFLVTSSGHLYCTFSEFRAPECQEYKIFEFDSTSMKWSNPKLGVFDSNSIKLPYDASRVVLARGDNYEDFVLLFHSKNSLIVFDLVSHKYVQEIKSPLHYRYTTCHYISSLAPV